MFLAAACTPPAIIKSIAPSFPSGLFQDPHGRSLTAGVRVVLAPDGSVSSTQITQTTGIPVFDDSATASVKQWKFSPPAPGCAADPSYVVGVEFSNVSLPAGPYDPCAHDALILNQVLPAFPDSARALGLRNVEVDTVVNVDAGGRLRTVTITRSSGNMTMDEATFKAARASVYAPKFVDCKPVPGSVPFAVVFR